jgi:hypothetical protein
VAGDLRRLGGELLQRLLLAIDLQRRNDRIERDDVCERHGTLPEALRVTNTRTEC